MDTTQGKQEPDRNLALDLVRVTEAAAIASARWLGLGQKEDGDAAAVAAMRATFSALDIDGQVVIGEGEKDEAPMLFNGERVGSGKGPAMDVAVDPLEGTNLLAMGRPNAIAVVALAPKGAFFDPKPGFYMKKLVVPAQARGLVDISAPVGDTLAIVAHALGKKVKDVVVFVLEKARHAQLITAIRQAGARIQLHTDGDVAGAIMAASPDSEVDVLMGTGGTPEGVLAAAAMRILGAEIQGMLDPQSPAERAALEAAGIDQSRILYTHELVKSDDIFFAATGVSGGTFLPGVEFPGHGGAVTTSLVMRGKTGTIRHIRSSHSLEKLRRFSVVDYDKAAA
ncbi:class II fructose-bisphosphatase [Fundidesulfovibrio putealis]|uniref:class II fructose-bisphosphatase n=1 Tax=Fundidesulfovibrio putealis TaxID=270496 RepID=UPI0004016786|nr:class II fructose-bisphosphatase [Fundidesulfovibrio putealis]